MQSSFKVTKTLAPKSVGVFFVLAGFFVTEITSPAQAEPRAHRVLIDQMRFQPSTLEVKVGDSVWFENQDIVPHTASSVPGRKFKFDSGTLQTGERFNLKIKVPGNLSYSCRFHPGMLGEIVAKKKNTD